MNPEPAGRGIPVTPDEPELSFHGYELGEPRRTPEGAAVVVLRRSLPGRAPIVLCRS